MRIEYDPALPISAHREEIVAALAAHPVLVVCGATGSGKSTQLPKLCLEAGRGGHGLIGHTQPRRVAARALATRIAAELGTSVEVPGKRKAHGALGAGLVGYKVRFNDRTGPSTRIKLMTDGILLKELETDRELRQYDTLIIDEAHERSLNIDLLLGVLRQLSSSRPELRVLVTSATIDPGRFAAFFGGAPVIEVSGRSYPVEVRYRPLNATDEDATEQSLQEGIVAAVRELDRESARGDTLVFLPGEKHIREAAAELRAAQLPNTEVLPLYARLSTRDQERIFQPHRDRRIVLTTNVAETSLTVPGVRHVIDSGLARISRYSTRAKVQRLPIEPISKASAEQRTGRCGREAPGICIRLYSEPEFEQRDEFTQPEVLRTNLASVILRMAVLGLGTPEEFPFIDPPDTRLVNDGVRLLQELRAMDADRRVSSLGVRIASLPVDPRLGRMLLAASHHGCVAQMLTIASFLEAQDPRERPTDAQQAAADKHATFADRRSDFLTLLNLWRQFREQAAQGSANQLRRWCRENFLSFVRLREWQDLHTQLSQGVQQLKLPARPGEASYSDVHQAILTGFLGSVGQLDQRREYEGPRGIRFVIAPGTPLASKPPKWIVAGSIVETSRLYARTVAAINPAWIESAAAHLVKRTYSEPHWVPGRGYVAAFEAVSLYGLTLIARRRVNYGPIAPAEAHEIFIREALIAGNAGLRAGFLESNQALKRQITALEARIRRRDILADEEAELEFYRARVPERVSSVAEFERWWARVERRAPALLCMTGSELMRRQAADAGIEHFPDDWPVGVNRLPLSYRFEPGEVDDGVTLIVPEPLVEQLDADQIAWLVPGWRHEKVTAVLRALPKSLRKLLVPVPEHARAALVALPTSSGFFASLSEWVTQRTGHEVTATELAALPLPPHLRMNLRVLDAADRVMIEDRDLSAVRRRVRASRRGAPRSLGASPVSANEEGKLHRQWDFGELPESAEIERNRIKLTVYPAIEDRQTAVALIEARSAEEAGALTRGGIMRLALLALRQQAQYIKKRLADDRELVLLSGGLPLAGSVAESLMRRSFMEAFAPVDLPLARNASVFSERLESGRGRLSETADRLVSVIIAVLREWRAVRSALAAPRVAPFAAATADIQRQLRLLLPADFIESVPWPWLFELPRFLRAAQRRIERLPANLQRDTELASQVAPFVDAYQQLLQQAGTSFPGSQLTRLRWMIEELRVSLYAQELKTTLRVSVKRLGEQLTLARAEVRI